VIVVNRFRVPEETAERFRVDLREALEALAARPGSRVVAMPTGHWVMVEKPDEFNRVLLDWLAPPSSA
jgi:pimeloyl-ACP methyl ester carboxylesterase